MTQDDAARAAPPDEAAQGWEWARVEVFDHFRHYGRTREEERFGAKLLRIDIPIGGDPANGWITMFYAGSAIFSFALCTREEALKANQPCGQPYIVPYRGPKKLEDDVVDIDEEDVPL